MKILFAGACLLASLTSFAQITVELLRSDGKLYYQAQDEVYYPVESTKIVDVATKCKGVDGVVFTAPAGSMVVKTTKFGEFLGYKDIREAGQAVEVVQQPAVNFQQQQFVPSQVNQGQVIQGQQFGNGAEGQLLSLVNQERTRRGLNPLAMSSDLQAGSARHSSRMATGQYKHDPNGGNENIAHGQRTAQEVFQDWMNSPGHRANILKQGATQFGGAGVNSFWTMRVR